MEFGRSGRDLGDILERKSAASGIDWAQVIQIAIKIGEALWKWWSERKQPSAIGAAK